MRKNKLYTLSTATTCFTAIVCCIISILFFYSPNISSAMISEVSAGPRTAHTDSDPF